jgi:hypothetical protein
MTDSDEKIKEEAKQISDFYKMKNWDDLELKRGWKK